MKNCPEKKLVRVSRGCSVGFCSVQVSRKEVSIVICRLSGFITFETQQDSERTDWKWFVVLSSTENILSARVSVISPTRLLATFLRLIPTHLNRGGGRVIVVIVGESDWVSGRYLHFEVGSC